MANNSRFAGILASRCWVKPRLGPACPRTPSMERKARAPLSAVRTKPQQRPASATRAGSSPSSSGLRECSAVGSSARVQQNLGWLIPTERRSRLQPLGEQLKLADRVVQFVQGYGFRAVLDGPLAVIQLQ